MFAKNELHNINSSSFKSYNKKEHKLENISEEEHRTFLELIELDNINIQRADKGNLIVIIDKNTYINKMINFLRLHLISATKN